MVWTISFCSQKPNVQKESIGRKGKREKMKDLRKRKRERETPKCFTCLHLKSDDEKWAIYSSQSYFNDRIHYDVWETIMKLHKNI